MTDTIPNSVWPNGLKKDAEGYTTFYLLGTNKVEINDITWPNGNKLVSPFVYDENDKLVNFCDTQALKNNDINSTITLPYEEVDAIFSSELLSIIKPNINNKNFKIQFEKSPSPINGISFVDMSEDTKTLVRSATKVVDNILYDENDEVICGYNFDRLTNGANVSTGYNSYYQADAVFYNVVTGDVDTSRNLPLFEFKSDLSSLENGCYTFYKTNINTFDGDLKNLKHGDTMFGNSKLSNITTNLDNLETGTYMFGGTSLIDFNIDMPKLRDGYQMFYCCINLTSFSSDLSGLEIGTNMFSVCNKLSSFKGKTRSLITSDDMFSNTKLAHFETDSLENIESSSSMFDGCLITDFDYDMKKVTYASAMFAYSKLKTFRGDMDKLVQADSMFRDTHLTSFRGKLSSLKSAYHMFSGDNCQLDEDSIKYISENINDISALDVNKDEDWMNKYVYWNYETQIMQTDYDTIWNKSSRGVIYLTYDSSIADKSNILKYCDDIANKGWKVYLNTKLQTANNGVLETNLIEGEETQIVTPLYFKMVETDEKYAKYTDGVKFYNILGGQYVFGDDLSTYGMFTSEEDAVVNMRLTKIEKN